VCAPLALSLSPPSRQLTTPRSHKQLKRFEAARKQWLAQQQWQTQQASRAGEPGARMQLIPWQAGAGASSAAASPAWASEAATPQYSPAPAREMSHEELSALRAAILRLQRSDTTRFTRVVRLIQEAVADFDGEIDLERIDPPTLWRMHEVAASARAAPKKRPRPAARLRTTVSGAPPAPPAVAAMDPQPAPQPPQRVGWNVPISDAEAPAGTTGIVLRHFSHDDDELSISDSDSDGHLEVSTRALDRMGLGRGWARRLLVAG